MTGEPAPGAPTPAERRERRDAVLTFVPATLVAFLLRWALVTTAGWERRRAMLAAIAFGIVLALVLQRALARRA